MSDALRTIAAPSFSSSDTVKSAALGASFAASITIETVASTEFRLASLAIKEKESVPL